MHSTLKTLTTAFMVTTVILTVAVAEPIRVACIGDSITAGARIKDKTQTYPAQLGDLLGEGYNVQNFGVSGRTLLVQAKPWRHTPQFNASQEFLPNIVVIKLGTNDSKNMFWAKYAANFERDYLALIEVFQGLESKPRIYICHPVPAYTPKDNEKINDGRISREIIPAIDRVAKQANVQIIDLHTTLSGKPELFPDRIHPNGAGARFIAEAVKKTISPDKKKQ